MSTGLEALTSMDYPGRFLIAGRSKSDELVVIYGLTGRSPPSKARRFVYDASSGVTRTDVTDPAILNQGSPALLLYPALAIHGNAIVGSNGAQTKLLYTQLRNNLNFDTHSHPEERVSPRDLVRNTLVAAMNGTPHLEYDQKDKRWIDISSFEPDAPNNTPRISLVALPQAAGFHIVRAGPEGEAIREDWIYLLQNGQGRIVSTYSGSISSPLPSFVGEPREIEIPGNNSKETTDAIFEALGINVRVAVTTIYLNDKVDASSISIHD